MNKRLLIKLAEKLKTELQPHQQRVLDKLKDVDSILAYHQLGSGKTLTSIAGTLGQKADIIVPASLRENYLKEIKNFTSGKNKRNVRSYEDFTKRGPSTNEAIVFDEAHRLGTSSTARSQRAVEEAKNYAKRILLTGTPIKNAPSDLGPLIKVLNPEADIPTSEAAFNKMFLSTDVDRGFLGKVKSRTVKPKNLDKLREALKGRVDYHQTDTSEFPSFEEITHRIEMDKDQEDVYRTVTNKANPIVAAKIRKNLPLTKKEQGSLNAFLTAGRITSNTAAPYQSGNTEMTNKLKKVLDNIGEEGKHFVYSNYIDGGLQGIADKLSELNIPHGMFTGKLNDKERKDLVSEYNKNKLKVLLAGPSGSEGLDLKGTTDVHILEPHWNEARVNQAIGRAIRYKSHSHLPEDQRHVNVHKYLSTLPNKKRLFGLLPDRKDTSADEYLDRMSKEKQELIDKFTQVLKEL